jgi:hypothetical protein
MSKKMTVLKTALVIAVLLGIAFGAPGLSAQERRGGRSMSRFSISASGGMGRTEDHQGFADLKMGIQLRLTPSIRLGVGFGYLKAQRYGKHGNDRMMAKSSWGGYGWEDGRSAESVDFRIQAMTIDLGYALPVGRKWDLTIGGEAGRYFGEFPTQFEEVHRRSWGGQGILGAEFRISAKLSAFAEAAYRFLEFHDIPMPAQMVPLMQVDEKIRPLVELINQGLAIWIPPQMTGVRLNGPGLRIGLRFGI